MWKPILAASHEQAERSGRAVRAAALMHIARVLAVSDGAAAEEILERGLALAKELSGQDRELILGEAPYIAAAVSPQVAISLYAATEEKEKHGSLIRLVNVMATHGYAAETVAYLSDPLHGQRFPLDFVNNIERECKDDDTHRDLLRAAIRAWRDPARASFGHFGFGREAFATFFTRSWELLPREEALAVLGEIVQWIGEVRDDRSRRRPITGKPGDPEFTAENQYLLFQILPALQRLDPALIDALCEKYPEFAVAAQRFPMGYESVQWEHTGSGVCGSEALGDAEAFAEAYERHEYDADAEDPNQAPKECWQSTNEFRDILFKAGRREGAAAVKYLERIPDADIRLFAQIELCAGMAGLPQIGHTSVGHVPTSRRAEFHEAMLDSLPEEMRSLLKAKIREGADVQFCIDAPLLKRKKKDQAD
jgi:hypothetical protein